MKQKSGPHKAPAERALKDIRRRTRRQYSAEEKIRIVLEGLRGDAMKPGMDFTQQLDAQVAQCRVLLAVIGRRWLEAEDQSGRRRLDSDKDYVRIELASALKRDIPVIPVLVDGAKMPSEESLTD